MLKIYILIILLLFSYCEILTKYNLNINSSFIINYESPSEEGDSNLVLVLEPFFKEFMLGKIYISLNAPFDNKNNLNDIPYLNVSTEEISSYSLEFKNKVHTIFLNLTGKFNGILTVFI